jgi:hypothetical protein
MTLRQKNTDTNNMAAPKPNSLHQTDSDQLHPMMVQGLLRSLHPMSAGTMNRNPTNVNDRALCHGLRVKESALNPF